jgi:hypothetical protein
VRVRALRSGLGVGRGLAGGNGRDILIWCADGNNGHPEAIHMVAVGTIIADRPPQSGGTVARSGLRTSNDADVSTVPPIIPYGGFKRHLAMPPATLRAKMESLSPFLSDSFIPYSAPESTQH